MAKVELKPVNKKIVRFGIRGTSSLVMHSWPEKAKEEMRAKHAGKKTKAREVRDPQKEADDATYRTHDGQVGIPGMALKKALISAAHKDIGIEKTLVRKALFLITPDDSLVVPIEADEPVMREDPVRVGQGGADLRYRNEFKNWRCDVAFEVDADLLRVEDIMALVDRAGFGVGICENRPEKNGEWGRFEIDSTVPVEME